MRIASVRVQGYRCLHDLAVDFDELTALIGSGGVGKSAFRALEWFFDDTALDEEDLHLSHEEDPKRAAELMVTVTFDNLSAADREVLGRYGGGPDDLHPHRAPWRGLQALGHRPGLQRL